MPYYQFYTAFTEYSKCSIVFRDREIIKKEKKPKLENNFLWCDYYVSITDEELCVIQLKFGPLIKVNNNVFRSVSDEINNKIIKYLQLSDNSDSC
jgi:hypothetical protein